MEKESLKGKLKIVSEGNGQHTFIYIGDKRVGCEVAIQEIDVNAKVGEINSATIKFFNVDWEIEVPIDNVTLKELELETED
jgi:hypothetical protein